MGSGKVSLQTIPQSPNAHLCSVCRFRNLRDPSVLVVLGALWLFIDCSPWKCTPASGWLRARSSRNGQVALSHSQAFVPCFDTLEVGSIRSVPSQQIIMSPTAYIRHVVCASPRRSVFDVIVAWHVFCRNDNPVSGISGQKKRCCQPSDAGSAIISTSIILSGADRTL